ncbi:MULTISPECIES: CinA family nicotinamide mononucleotide deamidase-related protein [Vibrio]|uniref:CinA family nicotinamide mononucleotide deamidase-related protein n=1 Tax=Vibrio TaxID=662 RepID=UPI000B5CB76C|nr:MULTISPECIES: CinA family nicotinamide mononucleotide deamidase-related protein [Vibrio]HBV75801.1 competence/damage-inducible protein A [Vibrio sp.]
MVKISMLSTGEEVLHGDIVDTNASWLSEVFFEHGFALNYRSTIGDQLDELRDEIISLSERNDVVIVNGGLGPTSDDLSALAAAQAAGVELKLSQHWLDTITEYFSRINRPMADSNIKQAMLPEGASVIDNPVGTACGFSIELNGAMVMFTPGVPFEFKKMVRDEILPKLKLCFPNVKRLVCNKIYTFGLGESGIADALSSLDIPEAFSLGYRSYMPFIEVKVFSPHSDSNIEMVLTAITERLKNYVLGINQPLIDVIGEGLTNKQWQLSILEQVTGGEVARQMYQSERSQQSFVQSVVDNQAEPLAELSDAILLNNEYRLETQSHACLANFKLEDGSIGLALSSQLGNYAQNIMFKRDYPIKAQQVLIATVLLDMLRRHMNGESPSIEFGHFETLSTIEKTDECR